MAKSKILVVGGAGYIGSYVNKLLNIAGYETVVLDNLVTGDARSVTRGTFVKGDFGNPQDLEKLFGKYTFDGVMHFGAYIAVGESVTDPEKYYRNNVVNTLTLLHEILKHKVNIFIFSSSAAVYGNPDSSLKMERITEFHPTNPINPYGETKLIVENILRDYSNAYPLRYSALRYFNAAGGDPEGEVKNYKTTQTNLIPVLLRSLRGPNGSINLFGTDYNTPDGTCIRDYIHIHDLAMAHILALEKLLAGGSSSIYNLGNGNGFSVREVIHAAEEVTHLKARVIESPRRPGDPAILVADSRKAQRELGWRPRHSDLLGIVKDAWDTTPSKKKNGSDICHLEG